MKTALFKWLPFGTKGPIFIATSGHTASTKVKKERERQKEEARSCTFQGCLEMFDSLKPSFRTGV